MTHILLASIAGNYALHLKSEINQHSLPLKATYITTAANVYDEKPWMEDDIRLFEASGFNITRADFANLSVNECQELLNKTKILIIGGGNVFYLLQIIHEKDLINPIKQRVNQGMAYVGSSAGSALAGPDIKPTSFLDDPAKAPHLKSTQGLELYNKTILPHYGKEKYKHLYDKTLKKYQSKYNLHLLTDTQAVQITNGKLEIIMCK